MRFQSETSVFKFFRLGARVDGAGPLAWSLIRSVVLLLSTTASLGRTYPRNGTNKGKQTTHCENSQLKATSVW